MGWKRRWLRFRTDGFFILNTFDNWLGKITAWMDKPGPSSDESLFAIDVDVQVENTNVMMLEPPFIAYVTLHTGPPTKGNEVMSIPVNKVLRNGDTLSVKFETSIINILEF